MREWIKYLLILGAVSGQIGGIVLLIIQFRWALYAFSGYGICLVLLLILLIFERKKEKEELDYDHCDY